MESARDSASLVAIASAKKACPLRLQNATSREKPEPISLGEAYKDICCVAYSPVHNAALMLSRSGRLNIATFATGKLIPLSDKRLDTVNWRQCSLGFSKNGLLGLALDRSGKLLGVKITASQKQS